MADRSVVVTLRANIAQYKLAMEEASRSTNKFADRLERSGVVSTTTERSIDRLSGRLRLLTEAATTVGPALIPLGAAAVPALTGLAAGMGAAAGAAGVAALALHGVGDALKAVDAYQLAPTAANLGKMRVELDKLGPAGAHFVQFLDGVEPEIRSLQMTAREGFFPGAEDGITEVLTRLPQVRRIVHDLATELGHLSSDAGHSLGGERWTRFFDYLERDAAPTLAGFAHAAGNVAEGLGSLMVAFAPLSRDFTRGLESMTRRFAEWAAGLSATDGFKEFVDYVRESGPQAVEFIGALSRAFVGIVHAAAPFGQTVLPVLTSLADVLGAIAESPVGPGLYTAVAGFVALNRVVSTMRPGVSALNDAFLDLRTSPNLAATAMQRFSRAARVASGAAGMSLLIGSLSETRDGLRAFESVAGGAMAGFAVGGPWGAALGSGVGLMLDFRAASHDASSAIDDFNRSLKGTDFSKTRASFEALQAKSTKLKADLADVHFILSKDWKDGLSDTWAGIQDTFGTGATEINDAADKSAAKLVNLTGVLQGVAVANNDFITAADNGLQNLPYGNLDDMARVAASVQPVLDKLGYTLQDLMSFKPGSPEAVKAINAINAALAAADSNAGRVKAVGAAVADLDDNMLSTAQSAGVLAQALDALLSPKMDLSAATDAWITSLRTLDDSLDKGSKTLRGNSDAAIKNRGAIRDRVKAMEAVLNAEAAAGASSAQLSRHLASQREALLKAGAAAGLSRAQMQVYLRTLGLTPKLVETLIRANTSGALAGINNVRNALGELRDKTIHITTLHSGTSVVEPHAQITKADGGTVPGARHPYGDKMLILAAPGEEVITNRHGEADQFRADRAAGRIPAYASGGTVGGGDGKKENPAIKALEKVLKHLEHASEKLAKALDKERAERDQTRQERHDLFDTVKTGLTSDIWAKRQSTLPPWLAASQMELPADPLAVLRGDAKNARRFLRLERNLRHRGLKGAAFQEAAANGGLEGLELLAGYSGAELKEYRHLFAQRERATTRAGQFAGDTVYGKELAIQTRHIESLVHQNKAMSQELREVKNHIAGLRHHGPKETGQAVGDAINGVAAGAQRKGGRR